MSEFELFLLILLFPGLASIIFLICVSLSVLIMPRAVTRQLRHRLAQFVLWQWVKGSKLSAVLHQWLWREGNGKTPEALQEYLDR